LEIKKASGKATLTARKAASRQLTTNN